jgi:hypothetical protein
MCHATGTEGGGISLAPSKAYANLVGVQSTESPTMARVKAGDPDASYLIHKLDGTQAKAGGHGSQMPFGGPYLDKPTIEAFRGWVREGANNN